MASLKYSATMSLDGYIADDNGNIDWTAPNKAVHAFVNDIERTMGTYLLGRRMHEVLSVWDTVARETAFTYTHTLHPRHGEGKRKVFLFER